MKTITTVLKTGNLRPKERMLLLAQNDVAKDTTGKEILTEADKHALSEGWKPKDNNEVKEYNRYNEGWRVEAGAVLDAQTTFLNAQTAHFRKQPLIFKLRTYSHHIEMRALLKRLADTKRVTIQEAIDITEGQRRVKLHDGLDFDYAVYKLAFERLDDTDKVRMQELYADVEFDHQYLDQEEVIANLLDGKETLTPDAKKKLADLVSERCYNAFAKEYQLYHYFACIPVAEVARYFLIDKGITIDGKVLSANQESSEWMFVKAFKERLDHYDPNLGLLYADDDRKHEGTHLDQELLIADTGATGDLNVFSMFGMAARRLSAFLEAEIFFKEVDKNGETVLAFNDQSLERVFIETKDDLVEGYATLLSFKELFQKLSKVYEVDLTYKIDGYLDKLEEYIDAHNEALAHAVGQIRDSEKKLFTHIKPALKIDSTLTIDKESIMPNSERTGEYFERFKDALGDDF